MVDTTQLYVSPQLVKLIQASIDPGFDGIFVPTQIAEQLMSNVQGVRRDPEDPRRWVSLSPPPC